MKQLGEIKGSQSDNALLPFLHGHKGLLESHGHSLSAPGQEVITEFLYFNRVVF